MGELTIGGEKHLCLERVRGLVTYDKKTGTLRWRTRPVRGEFSRTDKSWNTKNAGNIAGSLDHHGYRTISIDNIVVREHRLIWFMAYGTAPKGSIDHINGNRLDNRIENLREADHIKNAQNQKPHKDLWSGLKGAYWSIEKKKWYSRIRVEGRNINLGYFTDKISAHNAYLGAAIEHFGAFARSA